MIKLDKEGRAVMYKCDICTFYYDLQRGDHTISDVIVHQLDHVINRLGRPT